MGQPNRRAEIDEFSIINPILGEEQPGEREKEDRNRVQGHARGREATGTLDGTYSL